LGSWNKHPVMGRLHRNLSFWDQKGLELKTDNFPGCATKGFEFWAENLNTPPETINLKIQPFPPQKSQKLKSIDTPYFTQ
jgi:hypothetical protein